MWRPRARGGAPHRRIVRDLVVKVDEPSQPELIVFQTTINLCHAINRQGSEIKAPLVFKQLLLMLPGQVTGYRDHHHQRDLIELYRHGFSIDRDGLDMSSSSPGGLILVIEPTAGDRGQMPSEHCGNCRAITKELRSAGSGRAGIVINWTRVHGSTLMMRICTPRSITKIDFCIDREKNRKPGHPRPGFLTSVQ